MINLFNIVLRKYSNNNDVISTRSVEPLDNNNKPNVLFPDQLEASVRHLDAPVPRLLQLPGDSGELVPQSWESENQPQSGSNSPDICGGCVTEFHIDGPFELKNA